MRPRPQAPPATPWRQRTGRPTALLLGLALLLGASCHGSAQTAGASSASGGGTGDPGGSATAALEPAPAPAATVDHIRIFLIAPDDGGRSGRKVACGDSAVPVEVTLPQAAPALDSALHALLASRERNDRGTGLLNPLYASRLDLASIELQGAQAKVHLTGYVELGDACDNARMLAQLTETVLQFPGVSYVQFDLDGQSLRDLLTAGPAAPAPPSQPAPPPPG
jgi:hypothetical protein